MMPYNLLLLPVIVGYFVLIYSSLFKYNTQRLTQNRIIFESVSVAVIIVSAGFIARTIFELFFPKATPAIIEFLKVIPINKVDYLWTVIFSCFLTILLVFISNYYIKKKFKKDEPIAWAVDANGDEIEKLFKKIS